MGQPEWAAVRPKRKRQHREISDLESGSESEEEEEEGLLQRTGNLLAGTVEKLPGGSLDVRRMRDANSAKRAEAVVRAVEFHPSSSVLLTAGYHKTLDLFQVCWCHRSCLSVRSSKLINVYKKKHYPLLRPYLPLPAPSLLPSSSFYLHPSSILPPSSYLPSLLLSPLPPPIFPPSSYLPSLHPPRLMVRQIPYCRVSMLSVFLCVLPTSPAMVKR